MSDLETRLAKLERSVRLWRAGSLLAIAGGVLAVCVAAAPASKPSVETVTARRFVLIDDAGVTRMTIGTDLDNASRITMRDDKGKVGATLYAGPKDNGVIVGRPGDGTDAIALVALEKTAGMRIIDPKLKVYAAVMGVDGVGGMVQVNHAAGGEAGMLVAGPDGKGGVLLMNKAGDLVWKAP